jgi:hypothetical protein
VLSVNHHPLSRPKREGGFLWVSCHNPTLASRASKWGSISRSPNPHLHPEYEQAWFPPAPRRIATVAEATSPSPLRAAAPASLSTPLPCLNATGVVYFSLSRCPSPPSVRQRHPSRARRRFLVHPTPTLASNTSGWGFCFLYAAKATPPSNSVPLCLRHIPLRRTSPLTASTPLAAAWRPGRPVARQRARPSLAHNHTPSPTTARAPSTIQHTKKYHKRWSKSRTSQPQRIKSAAAALTPQ